MTRTHLGGSAAPSGLPAPPLMAGTLGHPFPAGLIVCTESLTPVSLSAWAGDSALRERGRRRSHGRAS